MLTYLFPYHFGNKRVDRMGILYNNVYNLPCNQRQVFNEMKFIFIKHWWHTKNISSTTVLIMKTVVGENHHKSFSTHLTQFFTILLYFSKPTNTYQYPAIRFVQQHSRSQVYMSNDKGGRSCNYKGAASSMSRQDNHTTRHNTTTAQTAYTTTFTQNTDTGTGEIWEMPVLCCVVVATDMRTPHSLSM